MVNKKIITRIDKFETKLDKLESKVDNVSDQQDINKLNAKCEVLNSRLFHQEAELYELKAVK